MFGTTYWFRLKGSSSPRRLPGIGFVCSCKGNDAGSDCFSENVKLVNSVSGAWGFGMG
jgi:hypothetical protein